MIDLRSDTVTRPSAGMRQAIAQAEVGDDVFGEDPNVSALQAEIAAITGKEAALFVTSGTMGNQLAIACHTERGDEVIVGEGAHVVFYESGAGAALSGVQFAIAGQGGTFTAAEMEASIKAPAYWSPRTSLVCVENTHNRAGGQIFPQADVLEIGSRAKARGFGYHLDGARIWNAAVALGVSVASLVAPFDSVSVCFSKGLGAPVGSALCGSRPLIQKAHRLRKMWGGGMRQAGILAAAARYALQNNIARLKEDHDKAIAFVHAITGSPIIGSPMTIDAASVQTNIVNIDLAVPADRVAELAQKKGLAINATSGTRLRAVMHLDVSLDDVLRGAAILRSAVSESRS